MVFNTWVNMRNAVFWDMTPCGSPKNRRYGATEALVTANVVPSSLIFFSLMTKAIRSSETSVLKQPHGVTSHNTALFIVTAVETSNLKQH
jgi:hypothetical protein